MPHVAAGALVFFVSAAILVLEIVAGRILAPYVGVTLETYTGIIGTVLAGIALGNWIGGRLADRVDPRRLLGPMVLLGGVFALVSPIAVSTLGSLVGTGGPVAIVGLAGVGFFAPAVVLAAVTPTVVKLQLASLDETGRIVGRYSALATTGAIVGTFATGFLLIAALPSRTIVLTVGTALVVLGVVLLAVLPSDRVVRTTPLVLLACGAAVMGLVVPDDCDQESPYFCASIVPDPDRPSGRSLILDTLRHSYVDLDDPTHLEIHYMRMLADATLLAAPPGEPVRALHIGGGGFTIPQYLAATRPGSVSTVLELDPGLIRLAQEELGLVLGDGIEAVPGDARQTIRSVTGPYDVVYGDAFGGLSVPWHLTTVEFLALVHTQLRPGGVYAMNIIDHPPLGFVRATAATAGEVFAHVAVFATEPRLAGRDGGNFVLVASDAPIDPPAIIAGPEAGADHVAVLDGGRLDEFTAGARVLVDDFAPVDQLLTLRR